MCSALEHDKGCVDKLALGWAWVWVYMYGRRRIQNVVAAARLCYGKCEPNPPKKDWLEVLVVWSYVRYPVSSLRLWRHQPASATWLYSFSCFNALMHSHMTRQSHKLLLLLHARQIRAPRWNSLRISSQLQNVKYMLMYKTQAASVQCTCTVPSVRDVYWTKVWCVTTYVDAACLRPRLSPEVVISVAAASQVSLS